MLGITGKFDLTSCRSSYISHCNGILMKSLLLCRSCVRRFLMDQRRQYSDGPRDYGAAVAALNTLQSNASMLEAIKKLGPGSNKQALPEMREWVRRIGYEVCVNPILL